MRRVVITQGGETMRTVVITGMGVISPLGNTVEAFWDQLISGRSAVKSLKDITHCDLFNRLGGMSYLSQVIVRSRAFRGSSTVA